MYCNFDAYYNSARSITTHYHNGWVSWISQTAEITAYTARSSNHEPGSITFMPIASRISLIFLSNGEASPRRSQVSKTVRAHQSLCRVFYNVGTKIRVSLMQRGVNVRSIHNQKLDFSLGFVISPDQHWLQHCSWAALWGRDAISMTVRWAVAATADSTWPAEPRNTNKRIPMIDLV